MPTSKSISNLRRRVNRACRFPHNTCAASRHVHLIAETMLFGRLVDQAEAQYVAESMLSVLESLFKARTELARKRED